MSIENIEAEDVKFGVGIDFELGNEQVWNGRTVQKNGGRNALVPSKEEFIERFFASDIICLKGCVEASGSIDSNGNKEIGIGVKVENDSGSVSGGVSGSISSDSSGNTTEKAEGNITIKF